MAENWYSMKAAANGSLSISIYDEIGFFGVNAADFKRTLDDYGPVAEINLSLHSPGGAVFEGLAIYNQLKNHPATVNVHIDGIAASIASLIAMAGDSITMPENAFMMIHKPWAVSKGDAEKLRENADLLDKVEKTLISAYRDQTGLSDDDLSEMLAAETWLSGPEALELGFATSIAEPIEAAASFKSTFVERFNAMPESLKGKGGNAAEPQNVAEPVAAPTPEPVAAAPAPAPAAPAPSVDDFRAADTARRESIDAVFAGHDGFDELRAACLNDYDCDADSAARQLLARIGESKAPSAAQIHVGNGAIVRDGIRNALSARVGNEEIESGNAYAGFTLVELARASLVEHGAGVAGQDRLTLIGNAFTHSTGDFGIALSDVAHKSMLKGYDEVEETFESWTSKGTLTDFREATRVDLSRFPSLRKVNEGAEFKYVTTSDRAEKIMLATYGEMFSITRQAIINDDLSVFDRIPRMFGRAAKRTIGDMVYAVLTGNPQMSDGVALFHNGSHKNTVTGAFDVAKIDEMKVKMMTQKEGGASLGIRPATLIVPVAAESQAKSLLDAEYDPAYADQNVPNPVRGLVGVVAEHRLDDASASIRYMVASPSQYDTVEVAYLDGNETPFLDQQSGFEVDGVKHKVRIDAGVAPMSFRTFVRQSDS